MRLVTSWQRASIVQRSPCHSARRLLRCRFVGAQCEGQRKERGEGKKEMGEIEERVMKETRDKSEGKRKTDKACERERGRGISSERDRRREAGRGKERKRRARRESKRGGTETTKGRTRKKGKREGGRETGNRGDTDKGERKQEPLERQPFQLPFLCPVSVSCLFFSLSLPPPPALLLVLI